MLTAIETPGLEQEVQKAQDKLALLHKTALADATTIQQLHEAVSEANTSEVKALSARHSDIYKEESVEAKRRLKGWTTACVPKQTQSCLVQC